MKKWIAIVLGAVLLISMVGCGNTGATKKVETFDTFVAGFGKTIITPEYAVNLDSHGDTATRVSKGVLTDLFALTVAMSDTEGNTVLWITTDLTHGTITMANVVRKAVEEKYGIPKENVILGGTHNHSSVAYGYESEANKKFDEDWLAGVMKSIDAAMADRAPATMEIGRTESEGLAFSRRYWREDGNLLSGGPEKYSTPSNSPLKSHESEVDEEIQMVRFVREGKKDILITQWQNHACYLSGNPSNEDHYKLSAEWPGILRDKVEAELDVYCIYFQGAAANLSEKSKIAGETKSQSFADHGNKLADYVIAAYNDGTTFEKKETGTIQTNQTYLTPERSGAWSSTDPEMNAISIGDVALVTLPQEMFDSDGKYIKEESPFAMTLIMGYACSTSGYAAPDWAAPNGGYETVNGPFKLGTAELFKDHYIKTLKTLFEQK
jgi:hypothetical protein